MRHFDESGFCDLSRDTLNTLICAIRLIHANLLILHTISILNTYYRSNKKKVKYFITVAAIQLNIKKSYKILKIVLTHGNLHGL